MRALARSCAPKSARVAHGGSQAATDKHRAAGKLTARERMRVLLDTGSPFLEFSQLAAHGMYGGDIACAGIVTGIGRVAGANAWSSPTIRPSRAAPTTRSR